MDATNAVVTARLAQPEELEQMESRLIESGFTFSDIRTTPCFVAEQDGRLIGLLVARLLTEPVSIWQGEPLLVFPEVENVSTRRRAMYLLWREFEQWLQSDLNGSGFRRFLAITYDTKAKQLFTHAGLTKLEACDAQPFAHLTTDEGAEFFIRQL